MQNGYYPPLTFFKEEIIDQRGTTSKFLGREKRRKRERKQKLCFGMKKGEIKEELKDNIIF